MKLQFNKTYFSGFILLFTIEFLIAIYLKDGFIRHTFGDFLVVILLYCFIKSFININPLSAGILVLIIAFTIEFLQLFQLLKFLNLEHNYIAKLVLGSTFQIGDLVAYILGIITVLLVEKSNQRTP
ncbi:ribosomal maturation YjgA family protein [Hanstruepera marina]|uniref:ribosomal maturation YjgA family protein n=1 Tax=Hanstruepera marina TaxID=2873265 RepID=UPI001CA6FA66|nr:DUF2809 domain-containing protein [Hanstruepera marina]